jgi:KUP system potassium uptake protein
MGHFGRKPIQRAWIFVVMPSLILCYLGEGAAVLLSPDAVHSPFFAMAPGGAWVIPFVAIAALATIIASQALITGVFSLTHQAMRLGFFPRVLTLHTSADAHGQIYVPLLNWFLAIGSIALVIVFQHSSKLAAAFGLAVSGTMLITAFIYYAVTRHRFEWSLPKALGLLVFFLSFDIPFVVANCFKFIEGGYIPFLVGVFFVTIMVVWRRGRSLLAEHMQALAKPLPAFIDELEPRILGRVPGTAVVLASTPGFVPPALRRMVDRFRIVYEHMLIVSVTSESVPFVSVADRVETKSLAKGFHLVLLRYGFMQTPNVPAALELVPELAHPGGQTVYVVGRETFVARPTGRMGRVAESLFALLSRNAHAVSDTFGIPHERVIELGAQIDL